MLDTLPPEWPLAALSSFLGRSLRAGLHARRHEAELRLRAAEQNLARLEDVINQLAAQMDSLKKQARQAIRYRVVAQQVRKAEATLFHLRWVAANGELAEADSAKNAAVRVVAERTGEQAEVQRRPRSSPRVGAGVEVHHLPRPRGRRDRRAHRPFLAGATSRVAKVVPWPAACCDILRAAPST